MSRVQWSFAAFLLAAGPACVVSAVLNQRRELREPLQLNTFDSSLEANATSDAIVQTNVTNESTGGDSPPLNGEANISESPRADSKLESMSTWKARQDHVRNHFWAIKDDLVVAPYSNSHPCWLMEWYQLKDGLVYLCAFVLFFAGVLCAAGGIGGGGVYVTVLMVTGGLGITDAVPLSHSIVFSGSLITLALNMKKQMEAPPNAPKLIDYGICRLVVPGALGGTYIGVLLNSALPGWVLSMLLTGILIFITVMVYRTMMKQYREETVAAAPEATSQDAASGGTSGGGDGAAARPTAANKHKGSVAQSAATIHATWVDSLIFFGTLFTIILFSVFRFHAGNCQHAMPHEVGEKCNHRVVAYLGAGTLQNWMQDDDTSTFIAIFAFIIPLGCAFSALLINAVRNAKQGWKYSESAKYITMSVITGALSGMVGIGGGLIFSPFFLVSGIEPSVAVATSSTCVIFTASSTTMQYLLTDRVIMSLTFLYGFINIMASYAGTKAVHFMQEKYGSRKSFISIIVFVGVAMSLVLAIYKFIDKLVKTFGAGTGSATPITRLGWE